MATSMHGCQSPPRGWRGASFRCVRLARKLLVTATVALAPAVHHCTPALAATLPPGFDQQTLASNLSRPTAVAWAPDGRLFIASKDGIVQVVSPSGVLSPTPLIDI